MKNSIYALLAACVFACGTLFAGNPLEPQKARVEKIGTEPVITLVKNGEIGFEIVTGKTPSAQYAASIAAKQLGRVFGKQISVLKTPTGKVPALLFGTVNPDIPDRDGFIIRTEGENVIIAGRDDPKGKPETISSGLSPEHGTVNAAFEFLERFAGIRFYFPGDIGTVAPKRTEWTLPAIDIYERPDWMHRDFYNDVYNGLGRAVTPEEFVYLRRSTMLIPSCHGLAFLGFPARFEKTHPEYFALKDDGSRYTGGLKGKSSYYGYLCHSSGINDEIAKDAIAFLSGKPASSRGIVLNGKSYWSHSRYPAGVPYFDIMPNDSFYRCRCAECQKHFSQGPQATSNFIWSVFADIANQVKASGVKGGVSTMAYEDYRLVPDVKIPENIEVKLALRGPWNEHNPAALAKDMKFLDGWYRKLGRKVRLWTYPSKYAIDLPGIPYTAPRACASFCKRVAKQSGGGFFEAGSDRPAHNYLNFYVISRIAWNNGTDVESLLKEYYRLMFGAAAPEMEEFDRAVEKHWMRIVSNSVETSAGPVTVLPQTSVVWNEIYSEKEMARLEGLFRKALAAVRNDPESLKRVQFMKQEFLDPAAAKRREWLASMSNRNHWTVSVPSSVTLFPVKGPAEVKTLVSISADDANLIFKFDCEEPLTDKMSLAQRKADDPKIWQDSCVELFLNPSGDRKTYYQIEVNANGNLTDLKYENGVHNYQWDSGAKVICKIIKGKKWTAEITVPRKSLGIISPTGFPVNFFRWRALNGVQVTPGYHWTPGAIKNSDIEHWGRMLFVPDKRTSLIQNGDFDGTPVRRFLGSGDAMWFTSKAFPLDVATFIRGAASLKLTDEVSVAQYLKTLKPETEYVLSFYLKLENVKPVHPKRGFYVRFDEGSGHAQYLPAVAMTGSMPWRRMEFRFKTHQNTGSKTTPYIRFTFPKGSGTAWVDHVRLYEVNL